MCVWHREAKTASYHAIHSKVVVLGLQLHSVLVVPSNLGVTGEEKPLVVHDPVEHLHVKSREKVPQMNRDGLYFVLTAAEVRMTEPVITRICTDVWKHPE